MSSSAQVIELVGGQQVIQDPVKDAYDLIRLVRRGLPTQAVDTLLARGRLTLAELDRLVSVLIDPDFYYSSVRRSLWL